MYITIKQARAICCKATGLKVKDVSRNSFFGYDFAIIDRETQARILHSITDDHLNPVFREADLRELLPLHQDRINKVLCGECVY